MDQLLSWLQLLPALPPPVGPCLVGTIDCEVEIPSARRARMESVPLVSEYSPTVVLDSLLFRVYYPCERAEKLSNGYASWIPHHRAKEHLTAYAHLLGLSGIAASTFT